MIIGERIKTLRKSLKLTQEQFAARLKITKGFVSNLEKDRVQPSDQLVRLIHHEFSASEYWLLNGEGEMFLTPEEIVKENIITLGEKAFYEALMSLDEHHLKFLKNSLPHKNQSEDPILQNMIDFLIDLWSVGDDNLKAWAQVQFSRAFPEDIVEEVQKKHTKITDQASS